MIQVLIYNKDNGKQYTQFARTVAELSAIVNGSENIVVKNSNNFKEIPLEELKRLCEGYKRMCEYVDDYEKLIDNLINK